MKRLRKIGLLLTALLMLLQTSCLSYRDLDNMVFITSILIDRDEQNNLVFYFETFNSIRSSSVDANQERRIIYKIVTQNPGDALNQLETHTSEPVTLGHNKVLLFTERFARGGFGQTFELFDRWQDSSKRTLLGIYGGDTEYFAHPNHKEEIVTGLFLYDMLGEKQSVSLYGVKVNIKEFMNQKYIGDKVNSIPIINTSDDKDTRGQYYLSGLGMVKDYTMVGRISGQQAVYFNFLLDNDVYGNLSTENPEDKTKTVSLLLLGNRYRSDVKLEHDRLKVTIHLDLDTDISAVQGELELTDETLAEMEESMADKIERNCLDLFQEWKDKGTDIFDIQEKFERKYPKDGRTNIIEDTELEMDVKVEIDETTTVKNAR